MKGLKGERERGHHCCVYIVLVLSHVTQHDKPLGADKTSLVLSPDLIQHIYTVSIYILKVIRAGVGFGSGAKTKASYIIILGWKAEKLHYMRQT